MKDFKTLELKFLNNLPKDLINAIINSQSTTQVDGKYNISEYFLENMIAQIRQKYMGVNGIDELIKF